jgi:hypothetical protein
LHFFMTVSSLSKGRSIAAVAVVALILSSTTFILYDKVSQGTTDGFFRQGLREFESSNFGTASDLFNRSYLSYLAARDHNGALTSYNMMVRSDEVLFDYCLDRPQAEKVLADTFPGVPQSERNSWLDNESIEKIMTDGQERFYGDIAKNLAFRNLTLLHQLMDAPGPNMVKEMMKEVLEADANRTGTYFNPVNYTSNGTLTMQREDLPATGTLSIWIPAPIETASQTNVTLLSVQPNAWVKTIPSPHDGLGQIYLETSLDNLTSDLVVSVVYSLTVFQKHFDIDPAAAGEYDKSSTEYITYTASQDNIRITPEISAEAKAVVGNETNPYRQARLLYDYVTGNITYSFMPHFTLAALGIPESEYVRVHRYGDCGAQSLYYSALLRSLGVPARACGGFQTFHNGTGTHFWAEFYLPAYGWVPVDVTAADMMDWIPASAITDQERATYKQFYFGNLDRMRYVIQNDEDVTLTPIPAMTNPFPPTFQNAIGSCTTLEPGLPLKVMMGWSLVVTARP